MKIKTEELTGAALDWAVAQAEGQDAVLSNGEVCSFKTVAFREYKFVWEPSTNWAQGGPIIEREKIAVYPDSAPDMPEIKWSADAEDALCWGGPTPLIAAMRAYVVSKLGSEVEIPEELK